jgi:hypothetical protein
MRGQTTSCAVCHGEIRHYYEVFDHITCQPSPSEPTPEARPAEVHQREAKHLAWAFQKIENRWQRREWRRGRR